MKKLLLVLVVVAMASFLLVGCLPGISDDGDDDGVDDGVVEAAMTIEDEYTDAGGVTFVACGKDVIVTLPTAVETDFVVYAAVKVWDEGDEEYSYYFMEPGTPDATRTVWTIEDYTYPGCSDDGWRDWSWWGDYFCIDECEPICIVALVKHPCCPGEEVDLRVVSLDCIPPTFDLFVKFTDCWDECVTDDPCDPYVPGMSMEWTSRTTGACETVDCCEDTCSLVNGWSLVIETDPCEAPCDTETGTGCPVEGAFECGCLDYAPDTSEDVCYYVDFSFEDNVGNAVESTWKLCFDTDELVEFEVGSRDDDGDYVPGWDISPDIDVWLQVYWNRLEDCPPDDFVY